MKRMLQNSSTAKIELPTVTLTVAEMEAAAKIPLMRRTNEQLALHELTRRLIAKCREAYDNGEDVAETWGNRLEIIVPDEVLRLIAQQRASAAKVTPKLHWYAAFW